MESARVGNPPRVWIPPREIALGIVLRAHANLTESSSGEPRTNQATSKESRLGIDKGSRSKIILRRRDSYRNCSTMKKFERIVGACLRESPLHLLISAQKTLGWTHSYWRVNNGSRTAEMPVRGRAREDM